MLVDAGGDILAFAAAVSHYNRRLMRQSSDTTSLDFTLRSSSTGLSAASANATARKSRCTAAGARRRTAAASRTVLCCIHLADDEERPSAIISCPEVADRATRRCQ
jgi:hypothetical protein